MIVICETYDPSFSRPISLRAALMASVLKLPVVHRNNWREFKNHTPRVMIFIEGNTLFLPEMMRYWLQDKHNQVERVIFVMADFLSKPPSMFSWKRSIKYEIWSQFPTNRLDYQSKIVNWNLINSQKIPRNKDPQYVKEAIYYGTFRKNRLSFYEEFLPYFTVSTRKYDEDKFSMAKALIGPIHSLETLSNYGWTIYPLDSFQPCNPGPSQRFYEALAAGIPIAIHRSAVESIGKVPSKWIVDDMNDFRRFQTLNRQEVIDEQWNTYGDPESYDKLKQQIRSAYDNQA